MEYKWKVKKSERSMSLENFIYKQLGDWSHKQIKRSIDAKRAFVNGRNIFVSKWNLKPNDTVLFVPTQNDVPKLPTSRFHYVDVLHEDNDLIVTNKPPFVDYEEYTKIVVDYIKRKNRGKSYPYLGQMHRLDKETSGVMVFTKKKQANVLADQFRDHSVQKFYLALVCGRVPQEQGKITKPIEKGEFGEGRKVRIHDRLGKTAMTRYQVLERYAHATLLKVEIFTGRTHQIRIHLSDLGFPVVGDKLYGQDVAGRQIPARRHMLHAETLIFTHPITHKKMRIHAPMTKDFLALVETHPSSPLPQWCILLRPGWH